MPNQGMTEASIRPGLGEWEHMQVHDSGHTARLAALYESHATDVFHYAFHLTGRREDAEDVVQFVFLQAFATHETGTELLHPRKWLIKAAKHRSLNMLRDRREATVEGGKLRLAARDQPDPEEAEALESQHQAFVLRHWSGLSQDEIADVLETTAGAVESLLIGARRTLLEDQKQVRSECSRARDRLVMALAPTARERSHIASCRRCRTAQARLLRAS
jgi:RNA polymerase sigma-70 factor, ECF subfamily